MNATHSRYTYAKIGNHWIAWKDNKAIMERSDRQGNGRRNLLTALEKRGIVDAKYTPFDRKTATPLL